ncbi:peptidyl-glycine alpha-amidating monooxygenase-like [Gigantopelta aegis]|uniref:peptidyl-glycine alpha-amidating monooxygenase-like n=1 Tax=Gigantopelta aegis TaxID=1735272 RepID=UPI001B88937D|nr:peptidyl-glycine alpha-amidating monooxygenase-like [Gigantopelta aegis]
MMVFVRVAFVLLTLVSWSCGFKRYQTLIPNGDRVPHPCTKDSVWGGVGHIIPEGEGRRNAFGEHFQLNGKRWTRELCLMDSDTDGRTNGEELGDPDCVWRPGQVPSRTVNVSHPGICEPMTSHKCLMYNTWIVCGVKEFRCDTVNDTDMKNITLQFPVTDIPSTETNYYCMLFDLPVKNAHHLVAVQPVIDNKDIVHHMLVFGCNPSFTRYDSMSKTTPYPCGMVPHRSCSQIIGTWTVGSLGECMHENVGFTLGSGSYTTVALQIHWNNPSLLSGLQDSSGLRLYYTPHLRQNDAGILVVGVDYLQIDPMSASTATSPTDEYTATCHSRCTEAMFQSTIYITTAINHMHYLGVTQRIELYRNGSKVRDITYDRFYEYDNPVINTFDPPIEVRRGDEIKTMCIYKRPADGNPVCFGEATSDEMCYGFITYYPLHQLDRPWCTSRKTIPSCDRHYSHRKGKPIDNCDYSTFLSVSNVDGMYQRLLSNCAASNACGSRTCTNAVKKVMSHPCMSGNIANYLMYKLPFIDSGYKFLKLLIKCDCDRVTDFEYCERKVNGGLIGEYTNITPCVGGSNRIQSAIDRIASLMCILVLHVCFINKQL